MTTTQALSTVQDEAMAIHGLVEKRWRMVAREIALDIITPEQVLKNFAINDGEWDRMARHPRFQEMLQAERETWNSSLNTEERYKLKVWVILENNLETLHGYLNDPKFADASKVEIYKTLSKNVNLGVVDRSMAGGNGSGERFVLNINLGARQITVDKEVTPAGNMIEGEATEVVGADD